MSRRSGSVTEVAPEPAQSVAAQAGRPKPLKSQQPPERSRRYRGVGVGVTVLGSSVAVAGGPSFL
jgi:hypothetical protein